MYEAWRRSPHATAAHGLHVNAASWRAGPTAERQTRSAGDITHKEVGFVAGNGPGLGVKASRIVLRQSNRRSITGGSVHIQHRRGCPESEPACAIHPDGVGG